VQFLLKHDPHRAWRRTCGDDDKSRSTQRSTGLNTKETDVTKNEWIAEALRLADEYAMCYDNHLNIAEGSEQAKAARVALAAHLATQQTG